MTNDVNALPAEVEAFVERVGGGRLRSARRRPGGGRREAWLVELERPGDALAELFLRLDRSARVREDRDPYSTQRETEVYVALQETPIPVPRIHGALDVPAAVLSERATGETWFSRIRDPEEQRSVAQDFMRHLAALHRIDPATLEIPALGPVASAQACVQRELDAWRGVYSIHGERRDPLIEFSFDWLARNIPAYDGPVALVQGDTGPGNFLYEQGRVSAILDWELAHWSDPMDDIAWLSLRSVQEPFTHLPDRLAEYTRHSGIRIDAARVRYYRVFAELRIVIMGHARDVERRTEGEIGNALIYGALHHRLLVETLADVIGVALETPALPMPDPTDRDWLYGAMLDQFRDVIVPGSPDAFVAARAKGMARVLKHLAEADRRGRAFDAQELDDLASILGARPEDLRGGRERLAERVEEGGLTDFDLLRYFHRSTTRRTELARSASGVLAERHHPPLR